MADAREWTVLEALRWTADDLARRGIQAARLEAEVLLADAVGTTRVGLYLGHERVLTAQERVALRERVERRRRGEPVAYILGSREFYGLAISVDPRVLVPRPETEFLVDAALEVLPEHGAGGHVLDLGTGSGAIAIAVARARPTARIDAVDLSADAIAVARTNLLRHGAFGVHLWVGDLFDAVPDGEPYDVIVSNPPYIRTGDLSSLPTDVIDFEPHLALDGGPEGVTIVERILQGAPSRLVAGGRLALEVAAGQADAISAHIRDTNAFEEPSIRRDYAGIERVVVARTRSA